MSDDTVRALSVDLSGQVALVTGASQGLGRAMALRLAANGAKVACVARGAEKLAVTVEAIRSAGTAGVNPAARLGTAEAFACDVTSGESVQQTVEAVVEKWGRLDILVNNAGVNKDTLVLRMSDEEWDQVLSTNLRGTFLFTRSAARPMMSQRYGRIINIASVSGIIGNPGQANYSASKAGIIAFTKTVAKELASRKITANAVAPGFIESEMTAILGDAVLDEAKKRIPMKRLGQADEIADAVLFLASKAAGYVTGAVLVVDGGMTA